MKRSRILAFLVFNALLLLMGTVGCMFEHVGPNQDVVVQMPGSGRLSWRTAPGWIGQWFGDVTVYPQRDIYEFEGIKVRWNDGGHATIKGSVQFDYPSDQQSLSRIHNKYAGPDAVKKQLFQTVVDKVLYMTGPLMSSRESYAEKRTDVIRFVQDQIDNGVYRSEVKVVENTDQLTGQKTAATVASVMLTAGGVPVRQEAAAIKEFGFRAFNFSIQSIDYDDTVEKQIQAQQSIIMAVQTSIAKARQSEQDRITAEQTGMAAAATAKWEQEKIKAKAIVEAEQVRDVAKLSAEAAVQYEREQLLRANADATYKRMVMAADGALAPKLATLERINAMWASAFKDSSQPLVPTIVMGAGANGGSSVNSAQALMDLLMVNTSRQLAVDVRPVASHAQDVKK